MSDQENTKTDEPELLSDKPILSEQNFRFASLVAGGKSAPEAYKEIFPERSSSKWVAINAYKLAKSPKIKEYIDTIQQATRLQIVLELPDALERVKELAATAKAERVKLDANLELLDRGGMKAPQRIENLQIGIFGSLQPNDMKELLRKNLKGVKSNE